MYGYIALLCVVDYGGIMMDLTFMRDEEIKLFLVKK